MDEELVPASAILFVQRDGLPRRTRTGSRPRRLELHQRDEAVHLGLAGCESGQQAAQAQGLLAEVLAHPSVAGGRRVPLVEHQVDDLKDRRKARRPVRSHRDLKGDPEGGEGALGTDDALRDGRLGDEERARDLLGAQAAEQPQRQRHPRLGGQRRVAGDEHQAEDVVAHLVVERRVDIGFGGVRPGGQLVGEPAVPLVEPFFAPQVVDGAALGDGHEPGTRVVRHTCLRPLFEGGEERVLCELLGQPHVAHHPDKPGDDSRRLHLPDRVDRAVGVSGRHMPDQSIRPAECANPRSALWIGRRPGPFDRIQTDRRPGPFDRVQPAEAQSFDRTQTDRGPVLRSTPDRPKAGPRSVLRAEDLLDVTLTIADDLPEAPGQLDGLLLRARLDEREADNRLLRLGERPVGHGDTAAGG